MVNLIFVCVDNIRSRFADMAVSLNRSLLSNNKNKSKVNFGVFSSFSLLGMAVFKRFDKDDLQSATHLITKGSVNFKLFPFFVVVVVILIALLTFSPFLCCLCSYVCAFYTLVTLLVCFFILDFFLLLGLVLVITFLNST